MSPRPKKSRNCSCPHRPPGAQMFKPAGIPSSELVKVFVMLDELEALRLCDSLGMSQVEAGTQMGISRGTVQRLVKSGRAKLVSAVIDCQALVISEDANGTNPAQGRPSD